jgi:parallel beta-helix repeat protein
MKKYNLRVSFVFWIILILIGVSFLPVANSRVILKQDVSNLGSLILVDDDGDGDFTNIQDAIDSATAGDTIEVYSGEYNELVRVDKQLSLVGIDHEIGGGSGTGKPHVVVEGDEKDIFLLTADYCNISGFHITSTGYSSTGIYLEPSNHSQIYNNDFEELNAGIHLRYSSHNSFYNNFFYGSHKMYKGISVGIYSSYNNIYDNFITGNGYGITLRNFGEYNEVYNNTISDLHGSAIVVVEVYDTYISGNIISNCGGGIGVSVDDRNGNEIYNNTISGGGGITVYGKNFKIYNNKIDSGEHGIRLHGHHNEIYQNNVDNCKYGLQLEIYEMTPPMHCYENQVYNNNVTNCWHTGMWLEGIYSNDIHGNNINGNGRGIYGIFMEKSEDNHIYENNITNNEKYGIRVWDSEWNNIYHNNFINNPINGWCDRGEPNIFPNTWNTAYHGGNYWSDYTGVDKNKDGVGDTPYYLKDYDDNNPFDNEKDMYPLMEPDGRPNFKINRCYQYSKIIDLLQKEKYIFLQIVKFFKVIT